MRNEKYQPCRGCPIEVCTSDLELFEAPYPNDECWTRFDQREEAILFSTQSVRHTPPEEET